MCRDRYPRKLLRDPPVATKEKRTGHIKSSPSRCGRECASALRTRGQECTNAPRAKAFSSRFGCTLSGRAPKEAPKRPRPLQSEQAGKGLAFQTCPTHAAEDGGPLGFTETCLLEGGPHAIGPRNRFLGWTFRALVLVLCMLRYRELKNGLAAFFSTFLFKFGFYVCRYTRISF